MMRVLVTGGRYYKDGERIRWAMRKVTEKYGAENLTLICGMARGADSHAWEASQEMAWKDVMEFRADWETHGKSAGAIRNMRMLREGKPDMCLAFAGGKGTMHMIDLCVKAGVRIVSVPP